MVNFGLNSASILGIFLAVAGASLYFMRSVRPELSRDHDIFFAAVGLLCGGILFFQGWRFDPIMQFSQFLLTGAAIFFAVETIRLRNIATEQARRSTPIVERDRPVSKTRVYQDAELDSLEPYDMDEEYDNPRLEGYSESRRKSSTGYDRERPRPNANKNTEERYSNKDNTPKRRPRNTAPVKDDSYDAWDEDRDNYSEKRTATRPRRPRPENRPSADSYSRSKPKNRDLSDLGSSYEDDENPTNYVDYQPIDNSDSDDRDRDNPVNFDY
jgi:hypothetical protein